MMMRNEIIRISVFVSAALSSNQASSALPGVTSSAQTRDATEEPGAPTPPCGHNLPQPCTFTKSLPHTLRAPNFDTPTHVCTHKDERSKVSVTVPILIAPPSLF